MKKIYILALITLGGIHFTGCNNNDKNHFTAQNNKNETILYIHEKTVLCDNGEAHRVQCLQSRDAPSKEWEYFYQPIEGFNYEEGYRYKLKVKMEKIDEPAADSSDTRVILIKILDKLLIEHGVKYQ